MKTIFLLLGVAILTGHINLPAWVGFLSLVMTGVTISFQADAGANDSRKQAMRETR